MKKKTAIIIFIVLILLFVLLLIFLYSYYLFVEQKNSYVMNETFTIANWNLQIFGDKKANDTALMNLYAETINHYDIVFLQEIRDKDASSFAILCSMLVDYSCNISSRAGRSSSKEQYGVIYLKKFTMQNFIDYNPDALDRWERPPIRVDFSYGAYYFSVFNIHIKPNETVRELEELEYLVDAEKKYNNVVVLGDLNADCSYYDALKEDAFSSWSWVIQDNDDTTATNSDCAYDRIILNDDARNEFVGYGIYERTDSSISDHYLIWSRMRQQEYDGDTSIDSFIKGR